MIELERHIEILLLSNDCVIVPNLGGFVAHHIDARYDENDSTFLPPLRTLGFNPQLKMNDSLLVQSYIEAYDLSYPEALRRIEGEVEELRQYLETDGQIELNDLGVLHLNDEGNIEFEPCEAGILTPSLYGLGSFEMKPLATIMPEETDESSAAVVEMPQEENHEPAITISMSWLRNVVAVAAAIIAFFMIGTPVSNSNVQQSSFINISGSTEQLSDINRDSAQMSQPATVESSEVQETTDITTAETMETIDSSDPASENVFTLVLACQVSKRNADNFVETLRTAGFNEASVSEGKMTRVVYGSYSSESDALNALKSLRSQSRHFREAWVMRVK